MCGETKPLDLEHFHSNGKPHRAHPPFRWECIPCFQTSVKKRRAKAGRTRPRPAPRPAPPVQPAEVTDLRAVRIIDRMGMEDRAEYALEGCLPLTGSLFGFTDEDLDVTPVPRGCHDCYLTAGPGCKGMRCSSCPDRGLRMKRRAT